VRTKRFNTLHTSACSLNSGAVDGGSQVASSTSGNCWIKSPSTLIDPRNFGAYEDVQRLSGVVTSTSGSCTVSVAGANFSSADTGKYIVITDAVSGAANGPTYYGAIQAGSSGTSAIVSPCPSFSTSQTQYVYYGHDDSTAWNNAIVYAGSLFNTGGISGQPQINGGGLSSGVYTASINLSKNVQLGNIDFVALGVTMGLSNTGVVSITGSYSGSLYVTADAAFLPLNACYTSSGAISGARIGWDRIRPSA
jgi:hypothetical protein